MFSLIVCESVTRLPAACDSASLWEMPGNRELIVSISHTTGLFTLLFVSFLHISGSSTIDVSCQHEIVYCFLRPVLFLACYFLYLFVITVAFVLLERIQRLLMSAEKWPGHWRVQEITVLFVLLSGFVGAFKVHLWRLWQICKDAFTPLRPSPCISPSEHI